MGLFRLLFWIAVIFAAVWIWRRYMSKPKSTRPTEAAAAPMVRCAHCGVHVPKPQALSQDKQWYCSRAHLEQGPHAGDR
ncbi:PP0621 family protein [Ectopseudomonas mendocina]|uniref:PP0621 family protein n=1 Tax=Ectopseudomonas mendocina TaxID=300 RepID=UPI0005A8DC63|nr:PP0621 family protein [Pseudomonas mendocina]VEE14489.1 MYND finger [Pseudomonas mendocina]